MLEIREQSYEGVLGLGIARSRWATVSYTLVFERDNFHFFVLMSKWEVCLNYYLTALADVKRKTFISVINSDFLPSCLSVSEGADHLISRRWRHPTHPPLIGITIFLWTMSCCDRNTSSITKCYFFHDRQSRELDINWNIRENCSKNPWVLYPFKEMAS